MPINRKDKEQALLHLSVNVYNIHQKMIKEGKDKSKFKMYLEQLRLAMEVEEKIYQSLDIKEIQTYLAKFQNMPIVNTIKNTKDIISLEKTFYRVLNYLQTLCLWNEDPELQEVDYLYEYELNKLQEAVKNSIHSSIILEVKFILIYLNLLRRSKKARNMQEHYDVLFMNRLLEKKLLDYQLRPLHFDQIDDFITSNWNVKFEPEHEESFGNTCINSLLNYMDGIMNSTEPIKINRSEYVYQLTNYYMATPDQQRSYLDQGDKLFEDPRLTNEKEKIMNQFYYDIDSINQGNERVRKI